MISEQQLLRLLRKALSDYRFDSELADAIGVSRAFLSKVKLGKKRCGARIAKWLGFKRVTAYSTSEAMTTLRDDPKGVSTRELILRLRDELNNGIKYDRKRNVYILVWTARQVRSARREGDRLWKRLQKTAKMPPLAN